MTEGEPQLRMQTAYSVDCHDLDKFAAIHLEGYGATWRTLDSGYGEYHNGSHEEATVEVGAEIEDDEDQDFARWLMGEGYFYEPEDVRYHTELPGVPHILQWLCNIGKIPAGKYVVDVWW